MVLLAPTYEGAKLGLNMGDAAGGGSRMLNMKRRELATLLGAAAATTFLLPFTTWAQQRSGIPRIGYLFSLAQSQSQHLWEACRQGLRELGYTEGQNIILEPRWAEGRYELLPGLVAELERLKVDAMVVAATPTNIAAKAGTSTIPVVFVAVADPLRAGLIVSLSRPGGRFTGLSLLTPDMSGKRLELLGETVHNLSRVAVLLNPSNPANIIFAEETKAAAQKLRIELLLFEARNPEEVERAIEAAIADGANGLNVFDDPFIHSHRARIIVLAAKHRLPAMYGTREFADEGGLISYGPHRPDLYRRTAAFLDKILKGAKPADLPVEQPTKFELIVNLRAAKALGIDVPPMLLARADEIIE
jgi:putative tryptophan/tyrosine transport system substrate-binding protein